MSNLKLSCNSYSVTLVPNEFLDRYMPHANGEFVKVYLWLLRLSAADRGYSLSDVADMLSCTEKDVARALRYWEKTGLLKLAQDMDGEICGVTFVPFSSDVSDSANEAGTSHGPETGIRSTGGFLSGSSNQAANGSMAGSTEQTANSSMAGGTEQTMNGSRNGNTEQTINGTLPGNPNQTVNSSMTESTPESNADPYIGQNSVPNAAGNAAYNLGGQRQNSPAGSNVPKRKQLTASRITQLEDTEDFMYLLFVSGQYLGRNLTRTDIDTLAYFYDELHMAVDLIEYLIEYCVSNNHTSIRYIETVGLAWHSEGITTVDAAKEAGRKYNKDYYDIFKALGIRNHSPISAEIQLMDKWMKTYNFTMDMIREACTRTIMQTAKPTLTYADGILTRWFKENIHTLEDVKNKDDAHHQKKTQEPKKAIRGREKKPSGSFYNFEQRSYGSDLENRLLGIPTDSDSSGS